MAALFFIQKMKIKTPFSLFSLAFFAFAPLFACAQNMPDIYSKWNLSQNDINTRTETEIFNQTGKTIAEIQTAANAQDPLASMLLGLCHDKNFIPCEGITKNDDTAMQFYEIAAEAKITMAMVRLSNKLEAQAIANNQGDSSPRSLGLLIEAANLGNRKAAVILTSYAQNGIGGLAQNEAEYIKWLGRSTELGDLDSMPFYADHLLEGDGVTKNPILAAQYYKTAADAGDTYAMVKYAIMLHSGTDIAKDDVAAKNYLINAVEAGYIDSPEPTDILNRDFGIKCKSENNHVKCE